jgi:hypothetical protein
VGDVALGGTPRTKRGAIAIAIAIAIAVIALASTAATASAATTRAEYVAEVDQTCSASAPAFKRAFSKLEKIALRIPLPPENPQNAKRFLRKLKRSSKRLAKAQRSFDRIFADMVERIALGRSSDPISAAA